MIVYGKYADGTRLVITNSSSIKTHYASNNTQVATVGYNTNAGMFGAGVVTAVGPGQTSIFIQTGTSSSPVSFAVQVVVAQPPSSAPPPVITSVSPTAGIPGTTPVTITGTGFGTAQGSGFVQLGTMSATSVSSWSDTQIVATVPAGSMPGVAEVDQNGQNSNQVPFTTVVPTITNVSPSTGTQGTSVTITGTNFGPAQGSNSVIFNRGVATPTSWSDSSIVVPVPPTATTGNVLVMVNSVPSNGVSFTTTPGIINLAPPSGPVGASVTITGSNFGGAQSSNTVTFNGTPASPTTWGTTSIVAPVPSGATTGPVAVTVNGVSSNLPQFTAVPPPNIVGLSPTIGAVGALLTITGTGFGATQGTSTVTFNGTAAAAYASWSDTSINVMVPSGVTTGTVAVSVAGVTSNGLNFTVVPPPSITSVSPTSGAVGVTLTITGTNFGSTQGNGAVKFNGTAATTITSWSATSIKASVPSSATTGNVVVNASGVSSNGKPFTVLPTPAITSLSPATGAVSASVTITGTNFGSTQGSSTVKFNGMTATTITSWGATSIKASVPSGATTGNVIVTVGGVASNGLTFAVVAAPSITTLSPTSGVVGATVTIAGSNFGSTQGSGTVKFNATTATTITSWSAASINISVPSGATTGNVVVNASGVSSNGKSFTVLPTAAITSLSPPSGAVGTTITIAGTNFGSTQGGSTVTFNGKTATTITSWSATSIKAKVPTGATTGNVVVTVGGGASNGVKFTVN